MKRSIHTEDKGRRQFIKGMTVGVPGLILGGCLGGESPIRVALVGTGRRGGSLCRQLIDLMLRKEETEAADCPPVALVALCDVDPARVQIAAEKVLQATGQQVETFLDYAELLNRRDIDAVILATPNHWHATQTLWACEAGKDVYVEKPVCHTYLEGQALLQLAERGRRVIQVGLQNRSDIGLKAAIPRILQGELGAIRHVRALCYRTRESIGKRETPLKPPKGLTYKHWLGPAVDDPMALLREQFHYDWHWFWNTGGGELANQGPHELDLLRWVLGEPSPPTEVLSFGGRFAWDDAGQTPNMHFLRYMWNTTPAYFEIRDLWAQPSVRGAATFLGHRVGIIVDCEGGQFRGGRGGGFFYDLQGKRISAFKGDAGADHLPNFFRVVRSRRLHDLAAPLASAIASADLIHYGNTAQRLASPVSSSELHINMSDDPLFSDTLNRALQHLNNWHISPNDAQWNGSPALAIDEASGHFARKHSSLHNTMLLTPLEQSPNHNSRG